MTLASAQSSAQSSASRAADFRSLYADAFYQTRFFDWPRSRFSLTVRRNEAIVLGDGTATGQELQWEQDWIGGRYETLRPELTTTVGYARDQSDGSGAQLPHRRRAVPLLAGAVASASTGNLRYTSQQRRPLHEPWAVGLAHRRERPRARLARRHSPPTSTRRAPPWCHVALNTGPQLFRTTDKTVPTSTCAGRAPAAPPTRPPRARAPCGRGRRQRGGARVLRRQPRRRRSRSGEGGVANVEVLLDGRYRATTDRDGRFEFPLVTTGRHQLTLTSETACRCPGARRATAGTSVDVPLRGQATAAIPVTKVGAVTMPRHATAVFFCVRFHFTATQRQFR
jgi:hypothetical protein